MASIKERIEVLEVLQEWIQRGAGAEDALDDVQLYDAFKTFNAELLREESFPSSQRDSTDVKVKEAWRTFGKAKESLVTLFATHTKRPPIKKPNTDLHEISGDVYSRGAISDPPDIDRLSPEELVSSIDAMINAAFRNVTEDVSVIDCENIRWLTDVIIGYSGRIRTPRTPIHRPHWLVQRSRIYDERRRD